MNQRKFYQWIVKYSGIKNEKDIASCEKVFEKVPGIDNVLTTAMGLGLNVFSIEPLINEARAKASPSPAPAIVTTAPVPTAVDVQKSLSSPSAEGEKKVAEIRSLMAGLNKNQSQPSVPDANEKQPFYKKLLPSILKKKPGVQTVAAEAAVADKKPKMSKGKMIGISAGVLVLVVGAIVVISLLGKHSNASADPNITFDVASTDSQSALSTPTTDSSLNRGSSISPAPTATVAPKPWFVSVMETKSNSEPFLTKPKNFSDFVANFNWRWVFWQIGLVLLFFLLRMDRTAAGEISDIMVSSLGMSAFIVLVYFSQPIAAIIGGVAAFFGLVVAIPTWPFIMFGIGCNILLQLGATISGRRDYSALAIAGLFMTGAGIVWWFPNLLAMVILGVILMLAGIVVEGLEMSRTHQGGTAIFVALIMVAVFILTTWGISALAGLIANVAPTTVKLLVWLYYTIFTYRLFLGALVGLGIAFAAGLIGSQVLMPPENARTTLFDPRRKKKKNGNSTSLDTEPYLPQDGKPRDDVENRWTVNAQYDSMAFGVMLLYPLAFAVFTIVAALAKVG